MPFHEPPSNLHKYKNGSVKMYQNGPHLKLVVALVFIAFLSAFYFLEDITSTSYMEIIRRTGNYKVFEKSSYFSYMNATVTSLKREGYLVWNPSCRIPDVSPMHDSIKHFVKRRKPIKCNQHPLLSSLKRNGSVHTLIINTKHFGKYSKNKHPSCCYSLVQRLPIKDIRKYKKDYDSKYTVSDCKTFKDNVTFNGTEEFIKVNCTIKNGNKNKEVYSHMHAMASKTPKILEKFRNFDLNYEQKLSVMIIGMDSISRLNLIRSMPKTVKNLNKNGWLEYKGYNKMDDNTFPNLMAILTGYTLSQIRSICWLSPNHNLNNCPFIWNDFSKQGYVTAYAEDEPSIGTFNYHKAGFLESPTDYYLRPYMLAAENFLTKKVHSGLNSCLGPTTSAEHILTYAIDFALTVQNIPSFSLFWMNSFSHNDLNDPSTMDDRISTFLDDLTKTGALNTTLILFLSDHGMRFGNIRETYVGWLEERLPYIYFWVPEFYRKVFPEKYNNLILNANRLTSPFDLHLTLRDILGQATNGSGGCATCQSLFEEVSWNRSCQDVGVTEHWCTCSEYKSVPSDTNAIREMVRFILGELNGVLDNGTQFLNNGTKCAELKVRRILSVRSKVFAHSVGHSEYVILFETSPNEALFEATVSHKFKFKLIDTVSRINSYGSQSKCMNDAHLQKYCYCLDK